MNTPKKRPPTPRDPGDTGDDQSPFGFRRFGWIIIFVLLGVFVVAQLLTSPLVTGEKQIPISELKDRIEADQVESALLQEQVIVATPEEDALEQALAAREEGEPEFSKWRSVRARDDETLVPLLEANGVEYEAQYADGCEGGGFWMWIAPLLLIFLFWSFMLRRMNPMGGGTNPVMSFGKSKAKLNLENDTGVTFNDVAGADEAKEELSEIVEFLKTPEKFTRLGGKVPKGVLLMGPPGTGKTLLARAIAGEADVPFFNLSGSDFVEMFVGVGAARVRDLFEQAQDYAPCLIFVDELDAIGKSRQGNAMQSNEEREQTLNALLVEMDGFDAKSGIILLGATNRPEVLDPALLRPGRFDRQIVVDKPDVKGREAILKIHARHVIVAEDVELSVIAQQTPGFVGADLANAVNEAALLAARKEKKAVEMADFQEAIERVMAGLEKKNRRLTPKEKDIVAYHESGHAIVGQALNSTDRVHKVSIVSRGIAALGYTLQVPLEDRYLMTRTELYDKICGLLGGRAAEELIFKDISTGAGNDLQRVTDLARRIVVDFGMSDILGNVSYGDSGQDSFLGQMGMSNRKYSEKTAVVIDSEVQGLIERLYTKTLAILRENAELLREMAELLKDSEVLEGPELAELLSRVVPAHGHDGVPDFELPAPPVAPTAGDTDGTIGAGDATPTIAREPHDNADSATENPGE